MDPLTFATSGIALATVCLSIVNALRTIIETHKNCPEELKSLLQRADGLSFLLGRLDAVKHKLLAGDTAYIQRAFDEEACRKTVREMNDLVWKICRPEAGKQTGFLMTIRLIVKNSDVHLLLKRLNDHQHDIAAAIGIIDVDTDLDTKANTEAILRHMAHLKKDLASLGASVESLKTALTVGQSLDALQLASKPVSAFPANSNIPCPAYIPNRQQMPRSSIQFRTWHGATRQFGKETQYTRTRRELSDAAYCYLQSDLHAVLNYARTEYNQDWVNSIRLASGSNYPSGYAPIHQAAWQGVSVEEVQRLLDLGAWRTLRTIKSDLTPLDIARQFRHIHLYDILAPVIRHPLPSKTILKLEESLNNVIQTECKLNDDGVEMGKSATRYPEVTVLTEMVIPLIWFPINEDVNTRGFFIRLDGREIVVKSPYGQQFRIFADGTASKIEEAVILDGNGV
ncbi:hypothetical protein DFH08DRAFT_898644 [Mycena albidolilacea]|uniref:Azaphilone pigments biosynthesis cluster protein L N-terminal domain-containing protein n=1 Tax=Mycena albidolilacea TaxID=1033008 RepID=A0AAD6Z6X3_9AGAR|nr:hypothetical protein DFH08DRAFT_898644 [Mycena albidolilacea]